MKPAREPNRFKRLAIGPVGSGTRSLSLALLAANGIEPGGATTLVESEGEVQANSTPANRAGYLDRLAEIEAAVLRMKIPASFAD